MEDMLKIKIHFLTEKSGVSLPKRVIFKEGWVEMPTNNKLGIRIGKNKKVKFGKNKELKDAIIECLKLNKVRVVKTSKEKEYLKGLKMKREIEEESERVINGLQ